MIAERRIRIDEGLSLSDRDFPPYSGFGFLALSDLLPPGTTAERIRVEVLPSAPDRRIYAFASITDNATQDIILVTPE
jgi:hypothetical protein